MKPTKNFLILCCEKNYQNTYIDRVILMIMELKELKNIFAKKSFK